MGVTSAHVLLAAITLLVLLPAGADAFGAGNIASISKIEGQNFRTMQAMGSGYMKGLLTRK